MAPELRTSISDSKNKIMIYLFLCIVIILCATNGLLFYNLKSKMNLETEIAEIYNRSNTIEAYYLKLNEMYFNIREEYEYIYEEYSKNNLENNLIEKEYYDLLNYKKSILLDKYKIITLSPKKNITMRYEIPFSGYIELSFNSTEETYFWIGSSSIDQIYFSRYPSFPELKKSGSFKVPVLPEIIIHISNPSEEETLNLTYTITFIY